MSVIPGVEWVSHRHTFRVGRGQGDWDISFEVFGVIVTLLFGIMGFVWACMWERSLDGVFLQDKFDKEDIAQQTKMVQLNHVCKLA
jgi:hypothetical protein